MQQRFSLMSALAFGLWLAGCGQPPSGTMAVLEPPPGWRQQIREQRQNKDRFFRESAESPLLAENRASFEGLEYWPIREEWYLVGTIRFYDEPEPLEIVTTAGQIRPAEKVGWLSFERDGREHRLQVYRLRDQPRSPDATDFFLPFRDATSGRETYEAGRYVNLQGPLEGPYVLDFNEAYNPYCAYGGPERFACPVTPPENRLDLRIEAGERGPDGSHAEGA